MPVLRRRHTIPAMWTAWVLARIMLGFIISAIIPRADVVITYGILGNELSMMTEYLHAGTWPVEVLTAPSAIISMFLHRFCSDVHACRCPIRSCPK